MRKLLLSLLALFMVHCLVAQDISRQAITNGGGSAMVSTGNFNFSIGQAVVQTAEGSSFSLTQGFQQPEQFTDVGTITVLDQGTYAVFPNPTTGQFAVELTASEFIEGSIQIHDMLGQCIVAKELKPDNYHLEQFDFDQQYSGLYVVSLLDTDQNVLFNQKIIIQQ